MRSPNEKEIKEMNTEFRENILEMNPNAKFVDSESPKFKKSLKNISKKFGPALNALSKGPGEKINF